VEHPGVDEWLARKGRVKETDAIVHRLFGADVELEAETPTQTRYSKLFEKGYFRRIIFIGTI
jgi:MFS transporter, putative metabolite transport protein